MRILIDIGHPADIHFYRNVIRELKKKNHEIFISVMQRGNLPRLVKEEFGKASIIGKHSGGGFVRKMFCNFIRVLKLRSFIKKIKPDVVTSFSYYPSAAAFGMNIKSVAFHDDEEYKIQFLLCRLFAQKLVVPSFLNVNGSNIKKYRFYKELAYLGSKHFTPNKEILLKYNLKENQYAFIREIAPVSLNYKKLNTMNYKKIIDSIREKGLKIVVSLEDKSRKEEFKDCIIPEESTKGFHSLIFYSLFVISSGDTVAREAAIFGVPAFYIGKRDMGIHKELIANKLIIKIDNEDELLNHIKGTFTETKTSSKKIRSKYVQNIEDPVGIIVKEVTE